MKKLIAMLLALALVFSFAACSKPAEQPSEDPVSPEASESAFASSLDILNAIWDATAEESRFSAFGGNQNESAVMDAPGAFDLTDTYGLTGLLLIPESVHANLDDAASLVHMMNANVFTGAAVHVTGAEVSAVAEEIKTSILNNQFMCGSPEKLAMFSTGDYLFYAFGAEQAIDSFITNASAVSADVVEICVEPIA